ncbi:ABC transporter substrate-binding protein [Mucilaginibacter sp. KACC 22063]|uniref:ABC transporter substrate-binding protein n=1 Tax=Mucilaginibacter sp. KACC 22063 TaxID=3025666 RepID=UPI0023660A10|nr:helical backbone metal receptor [Mucilaginibacter sp. KACC 22063]WDF53989.1 helical backbone metal receptor [Mucilaginibacter sp. KACC 22063]
MPSDAIVKDQLGRQVTIQFPPQRIISIVPSQTELLYDLGLEESVVGITKFCIHPESWHQSKEKIGGTKQLDMDKIHALKPDLIIANKEENERSQIEELMQHYPVWISDINDLDGALDMINAVGEITGTEEKAMHVVSQITQSFANIKPLSNLADILYFIWRKPYMVAGQDTFISHMLTRCGFKNCVTTDRYPELNEEMQQLKPQVVFLSSEPYPFKEKHKAEFNVLYPGAFVHLVDGEMFSWYGSRLLYAADYFKQLINLVENQLVK